MEKVNFRDVDKLIPKMFSEFVVQIAKPLSWVIEELQQKEEVAEDRELNPTNFRWGFLVLVSDEILDC